jgi:hypothetical protein
MLSGRSIATTGLAAILGTVGGAQAFDGPKYPDWRGQWVGFFSPELSANGPGQAFAGWDQTKPWGLGQQAPLTPEYQAVLEASMAPGPVTDIPRGHPHQRTPTGDGCINLFLGASLPLGADETRLRLGVGAARAGHAVVV